jgi:hypothetical protein
MFGLLESHSYHPTTTTRLAPPESEAERALRAAEAEVDRLKSIVRSQEGAMKVAARVLLPYLHRAGSL